MLCTRKLTQHCRSTIYTSIKKNRKTKTRGLALQEVETRRRTQAQDPASHLPNHRQENLHKLLHTPPPNSLSSILNCARISNLNTCSDFKIYPESNHFLFPRSSPGQAPASPYLDQSSPLRSTGPRLPPLALTVQPSLKQPPEGAREHLSQAPPPLLPTALQGSHLTESKNPNAPAAHKALHNLVDHLLPFLLRPPLAYSAPAAWGFWLFCQHIRPGPCPGPLHRLCPLSRPLLL